MKKHLISIFLFTFLLISCKYNPFNHYEYCSEISLAPENGLILGELHYYEDSLGEWISTNDVDSVDTMVITDTIMHPKEIYLKSFSNCAYTIRMYVEKDECTRKKIHSEIEIDFFSFDTNYEVLSRVRMPMYYIGMDDNGLLIFQSFTADEKGKTIIFVNAVDQQDWESSWNYFVDDNPWAYVIKAKKSFRYRITYQGEVLYETPQEIEAKIVKGFLQSH